jgi:hypothetical protein
LVAAGAGINGGDMEGPWGVRVSTTAVWRRRLRLLMVAMARVGDQGRRSTEEEGTGEVAEPRSTTTPG